MNRRKFSFGLAALSIGPAAIASRDLRQPIRIVVPFTAGGPTDAQARAIATEMAELLGTNIVVDNKPGAGGMIGATEVARSAGDGRTLLYTFDGTLTQVPHTLRRPPFDALKDLVPIARCAVGGPVLLTHPSVPAASVRELVEYARQNVGAVSYASFGLGTVSHLYGELLAKVGNVSMTHVPYRGATDALGDLLAGRVQFTFNAPALVAQHVTEGKLRVLATTGNRRVRFLPNLPTMAEAGFNGFDAASWVGLFAPSAMLPEMVKRLNETVAVALRRPKLIKVWDLHAVESAIESPSVVAAILRRDHGMWGQLIKDVGIRPQ